eukprot:scaffold2277_cov137-Cylindrotheca_fusiformis.AAC.14
MKHRFILAPIVVCASFVLSDARATLLRKNRAQKGLEPRNGLQASIPSKHVSAQPSEVSTNRIVARDATKTTASVMMGTVLTFFLNNVKTRGPVRASGTVILLMSLVMPERFAIAATCGSFAGMANVPVIPTVGDSVALGCLCAAMMILFDQEQWLIGVGGRLGFIAQCACTTQFIISSFFRNPPESAALFGSYPAIIELILGLPFVSFCTIFGGLFMKNWREALARKGTKQTSLQPVYQRLSTPTAAVGVTGLLATLLFPTSVAGPVFSGSFIAMSSPSTIESRGALVMACFLGGLSQQLLSGVLIGGWGGKLGTASLMGVLLHNWLLKGNSAQASK